MLVAALALGALTGCEWARRILVGAEEEIHEGPFYTPPTPMPSGRPGDVLRAEPIRSAAAGVSAYRVIYHSTDLDGADILVSGVVAVPQGTPPAGGRTVVAWGHPTTGAEVRCAPSVGVDPFVSIEGFDALIARGYAVVATDYAGMGMPGVDSYLIGGTEGRNVLDAVRAAQRLDIGASGRVALWGHSQGGQAVLFAAQLAESYAPELEIESIAVAAPAVDLGGLLQADVDDVSGVTIGAYAFSAFASVYADTPGVDLSTILSPGAIGILPEMDSLCLLGQNQRLHELGAPYIDGGFLIADPTATEPWAALLRQNTPGGSRYDAPLFVAQGKDDRLVRPELTEAFVASQRALGTDVTSLSIPGTGHGLVALRALDELLPWMQRHAPPRLTG
ncbi:MAG: lipase [Micrococcales bacterium 73-13]|nr:MAG: lipase [Micrococcales bacterium 73-13]